MSESFELHIKSPRYKTNEISIQVGPDDYFQIASKSAYPINNSLSCKGMGISQFQSIKKVSNAMRYFPVSTKVKPNNKKAFINRISIQEVDHQDILVTGEIKTNIKKTSRCARSSIFKKPNESSSSNKFIKSQSNSEYRLKVGSFNDFKVTDPVKQKPNIYNPLINFTPNTLSMHYHQPSPKIFSKYHSPYSGCKIKNYVKNQAPSTNSNLLSNITHRRRFY